MRKPPADLKDTPTSAEADLLGEETSLVPPDSEGQPFSQPMAGQAAAGNLQQPQPAEDENQPGFIGERNRPDPA
ncbi:MAG: hypothetical protein V4731_00020 [Pseudomonadota bacterium]